MKVSLNIKIIDGPYGGGMQFARYLKEFLANKDISVTNSLDDNDIDIIIHISPFDFKSEYSSYSFLDAFAYKLKHPNTIISLRINECDERKNTNFMNYLLVKASGYCDHIIYIANWLKPLMENAGMPKNKPQSTILNGGDEKIFNTSNRAKWNGKEKMKIVTHHWGANYLKGHDIYKRLDDLLEEKEYNEKFKFTFIGNYPADIKYNNTTLIPPLSGVELAAELKKHHIYITASRNEPAGMHNVEGALCGLPILYINSGALPQYCSDFGIEFNEKNFEDKLIEMQNNYEELFKKMDDYKNTARNMGEKYTEMLHELYDRRDELSIKKNMLSRTIEYYLIKIYSVFFFLHWKIKLKIKDIFK